MRFFRSFLKFWVFVSAGTAVAALIVRKNLEVVDDPDSDELKLVAIFDGSSVRSTAASFRGGVVVAGFGGIELDLRRAQVRQDGAHLDLIAVFGGIEVVVPDTWHVSGHGIGVAGGFDLNRDEGDAAEGQPTLTVDVKAIFGGVGIKKRPVVEVVAESPSPSS